MKVDFGHVEFEANIWVKRFKPLDIIWHFKAPTKRKESEGSDAEFIIPERVYGIMDLKADNGVDFALEIQATDEAGNSVPVPPGEYSTAFSVDNTEILSLTDNGDGSGRVDSTGTLGVATLSAVVTRASDGAQWTGAEAFNVVVGDVAGVTVAFNFEEPTETTPDV